VADFTSFVGRQSGATQKANRPARYGEWRAKWLAGANAIFTDLTGFVLSTLIFLTIAGVVVAIGG